MEFIKFFLKKLGTSLWLFIALVSGAVACVFATSLFESLFLRQPPINNDLIFISKLALAIYALAIPLIFFKSAQLVRKTPRAYSSALFCGSVGIVMLYSLSSALSPHLAITSAAKKIAGDHPYCLSLPGNKSPRALSFVEMPRFFSFMGCSWPKDYDAAVYVEKAPDQYEIWHIKGNERYKIEWRSALKAVPCQTEKYYVEKPWPRPQPKHLSVFINGMLYKFPGEKTTVQHSAALYYTDYHTPVMLDISGSAGIYHLAPKSLYPRSIDSLSSWQKKEVLSEASPQDMNGTRLLPSGTLYYKTNVGSHLSADIVCESGCFLRFHKEPFDYYIEIPKTKIGSWQQIYDTVTAEVDSRRIDKPEDGDGPSP